MIKIKICTPVIGKTLNEFLTNLEKVQELSEMVELRVDQIKNVTDKDLKIIRKNTEKESIFTCRNIKMILEGFKLGFDYIDIDLSLVKDLKLSKLQRSKTILSFHDFKKTPNIEDLTILVDRMRKYNVDVLKIATTINNDQDINNLFKILLNKKENEKIIVVGMGKEGQITRILGPFLGSFLTFVSTQYGETALGQIDIFELKRIYKLLTINS